MNDILESLIEELKDAHDRIYEGTDISHEVGANDTGETCSICDTLKEAETDIHNLLGIGATQ